MRRLFALVWIVQTLNEGDVLMDLEDSARLPRAVGPKEPSLDAPLRQPGNELEQAVEWSAPRFDCSP